MKFYKYSKFINEDTEIDLDLEDIRYFKGSVQQFNNYWKKKANSNLNPHKNMEYEYPVKRKEIDDSLPYQDFINGKSPQVKYFLKTRKQGNG